MCYASDRDEMCTKEGIGVIVRRLETLMCSVLLLGLAGCAPNSPGTASNPQSKTVTAPQANSTANTTTPGNSSDALTYAAYYNTRFGYKLEVPTSFTQGTPPVDGDGLSWTSPDGQVSISVYGQYNVLGDTVSSAASKFAASHSGYQPTYEEKGNNWFTVTGTKTTASGTPEAFYIKQFIGPTYIESLEIDHPEGSQAQDDSLVTTVVNSFQPGSPSTH